MRYLAILTTAVIAILIATSPLSAPASQPPKITPTVSYIISSPEDTQIVYPNVYEKFTPACLNRDAMEPATSEDGHRVVYLCIVRRAPAIILTYAHDVPFDVVERAMRIPELRAASR
jgi:hypothetical protein